MSNVREPTAPTGGMTETVLNAPPLISILSGLPKMSDTEKVVLRMASHGYTPERIADILGKPLRAVTSIIQVRA